MRARTGNILVVVLTAASCVVVPPPSGPRQSPASPPPAGSPVARTQPPPGWHWLNPLPESGTLRAVAGRDASDLYVAGDRGLLVRSNDGGRSWTRLPLPTRADAHGLVVEGSDLWVAAAPLLHSTDGTTFQAANGVDASVAVDVVTPDDVWAVGPHTVERTLDGGRTWQAVTAAAAVRPLPPSTTGGTSTFVRFLGAPGGVLFALVETGEDQAMSHVELTYELMRSADLGRTWSPVQQLEARHIAACAPAPGLQTFVLRAAGDRLVLFGPAEAPVLMSTDGGAHFQEMPAPGGMTLEAAASSSSGMVAVGDAGAAAVLAPGAASFTTHGTGLADDLLAAWANDRIVIAVGRAGTIVRSDDGGVTWRRLAGDDDYSLTAVRQVDGALLAAGTGLHVLRSTDGGRTFARTVLPTPAGDSDDDLTALWAAGPTDVYAAGGYAVYCGPLATFHALIARSTDAGATWKVRTVGSGDGVILDVWGSGPDDVYAVGFSALYHSTDRGQTWQRSTNVCAGGRLGVCGVRVWGRGPDDVWVERGDGTYACSTDRGRTFLPATPPSPPPGPTYDAAKIADRTGYVRLPGFAAGDVGDASNGETILGTTFPGSSGPFYAVGTGATILERTR